MSESCTCAVSVWSSDVLNACHLSACHSGTRVAVCIVARVCVHVCMFMCLCGVQYTPDELETLPDIMQRVRGVTLVVDDQLTIHITAPDSHRDKHVGSFRAALAVLNSFRVRRTSDRAQLRVVLHGFAPTHELIDELSSLPVFDFPVALSLERYDQAPYEQASYDLLPRRLPRCYTHLTLGPGRLPASHLIALCEGAAQRGEGHSRLRLSVEHYGLVFLTKERCWGPSEMRVFYPDECRSAVEQALDERGIGSAVELQWCRAFHTSEDF